MTDGLWRTRADPALTREYGVEELHHAFFEPPGWPGKGPTVSLGIPECELILATVGADGEPQALVNRPQHNRSVKQWTRSACEMAACARAC